MAEGGFFSLDIFYVLSGYLITGLLLGEYATRGRIVLTQFWLRRARRLLPALLVLLVVVSLVVRFAQPAGLFPDYRMGALSALFYFSNWWQIAASSNYFLVTAVSSPLTHTWSLAVEEQFYLVWPLVVVAAMHLARSFARGVRVLLVVSALGAAASMVEMAVLYSPTANLTRLYFGTDTHAQSILVGAVLACTMTLIQAGRGRGGMAPHARSRTARVVLTAVGGAGLAGTLILSSTLYGTSSLDYRGGFMLSALSAAALVIGAVCVPGGALARCLSVRPLVWMGMVSYGAYLWHYPVFVELDATRTDTNGLGLLCLRFAATFVLATASYYLVERPVLEGVFWRSPRALGPAVTLVVGTAVLVVAATELPASAAVSVHSFRTASPQAAPPVVVVLGDSTALTLGYALAATAPPGTRVVTDGLYGCGLAIGSWVSNDPPTAQLAMFPACNEATAADRQWPRLDELSVSGTAPRRRGPVRGWGVGGSGHGPSGSMGRHHRSVVPALRALADALGGADRNGPRSTSRLHHHAGHGQRRELRPGAVSAGPVAQTGHLRPPDPDGRGRVPAIGGRHRLWRSALPGWRLPRGPGWRAGQDAGRDPHPVVRPGEPVRRQLDRRGRPCVLRLALPPSVAADPGNRPRRWSEIAGQPHPVVEAGPASAGRPRLPEPEREAEADDASQEEDHPERREAAVMLEDRAAGRVGSDPDTGRSEVSGDPHAGRTPDDRGDSRPPTTGEEEEPGGPGDERHEAAPHGHGPTGRAPSLRDGGIGDDAAGRGPGGGEGPGVEDGIAEHLLRGDTVGFGFGKVRCEVGRHLAGDRVRYSEPAPFLAALIHEPVHHTPASMGPSTASTASRVVRHSAMPDAKARAPCRERL